MLHTTFEHTTMHEGLWTAFIERLLLVEEPDKRRVLEEGQTDKERRPHCGVCILEPNRANLGLGSSLLVRPQHYVSCNWLIYLPEHLDDPQIAN